MGGWLVGDNIVLVKSKSFAIRVVRLYQHLTETKKEFVLSKQLLRSGTSVGANVREAVNAQSKKDFVSKMGVALKEAAESEYWIELLAETSYLTTVESESIAQDCKELVRLLVSIIKSGKQGLINN
ncbi:MAG: four helix bundle protein [Kiritimatiellaeota bacterium]|nr:four helix bundle protein [Kiritimatiellota bacterium]